MDKKTLKEILSEEIEVPKSYQRYLSYKLDSQNDNEIVISTPRGALVSFEIVNNTLKKINKATMVMPKVREKKNVSNDIMLDNSVGIEDLKQEVNVLVKDPLEEKIKPIEIHSNIDEKVTLLEDKIDKLEESLQNYIGDVGQFGKKVDAINFSLEDQLLTLNERLKTVEENVKVTEKIQELETKLKKQEKLIEKQNTLLKSLDKIRDIEEKLSKQEGIIEKQTKTLEVASKIKDIEEKLFEQEEIIEKQTQTLEVVKDIEIKLDKQKKAFAKQTKAIEIQQKEKDKEKEDKEKKKVETFEAIQSRLEVLEHDVEETQVLSKKVKKLESKAKKSDELLKTQALMIENQRKFAYQIKFFFLNIVDFGKYIKHHKKISFVAGVFLVALILFIWRPWEEESQVEDHVLPEHQRVFAKKNKGNSKSRGKLLYKGRWIRTRERGKFVENNDFEKLPDITKWIQQSKSKSVDDRIGAVKGLEKVGTPTAARYITNLLSDKDIQVKWLAIRALGKIKNYKPSRFALRRILRNKDESEENKKEAIIALGKIGNSRDKRAFIKILKDLKNSEDLRANALEAILLIGDSSIASSLLPFLDDQSPLIREITANVLGVFNYPYATEKLISLVRSDEELEVQIASVKALGQIKTKAKVILPKLLEIYKDTSLDKGLKKELKRSLQSLVKYSGVSHSLKKQVYDTIK